MKNKIFSLFGFAVLALLVLTSFASAAITLSATNPTALLQTAGAHTFTFTVTSDVGVTDTIGFTAPTITDINAKTIVFTPVAPVSYTLVANVPSTPITMTYTVNPDFNFEFEEAYTTILTADGALDDTQTLSFTENTNFYNGANQGNLAISDLSFNVVEGFGDDEDYWYPLDNVEVEFTVENNGNWDIQNVEINACLWDESAEKCVLDEGDMEIDKDKFDVDSDEDQKVVLSFQVDADKLTAGNKDYTFYVSAVGKIDDSDSTYNDDDTGDSDSKAIEIVTDDTFVVLDNVQISESVSCGNQVQVTADVWNLGDEKQKDVYVVLYNKELGINQKVTIEDISSFKDEKLDALITIPQNVEEKSYALTMTVYDEDSDAYQNSNDDYSKSDVTLKVAGSCSNLPLASVSANLQSEAKAGQELIVKATVANTGSVSKTFGIELSGYEDWATLVSIDKTSLNLNSKATGDVLVTLKVNAGVSGEQAFNVVVKDGTKVLPQPVTVTVESTSIFAGLTGLITGNGKGNLYLWGIGALNLVLVLVIIFVAIKVVKKKKK